MPNAYSGGTANSGAHHCNDHGNVGNQSNPSTPVVMPCKVNETLAILNVGSEKPTKLDNLSGVY